MTRSSDKEDPGKQVQPLSAHLASLREETRRTAGYPGSPGNRGAPARARLGEAVLAHEEGLAQIEARDTGKPLTTARNDIKVLARYFEFYGNAADKVHGETIPFLAGHQVSLLREPLGVTAHIIPRNYPAQMLGRTVAPALAMGNSTVLEPDEDSSPSALRVAEIAAAAGLPEGVLNIVTGRGRRPAPSAAATAARRACSHSRK